MTDEGQQAVRRSMWLDAEISGFEVERLNRPPRRLSRDEKAVIVAERHRPDASLAEVARGHRVSSDNLRNWVRKDREAGIPEPKKEEAPPFPSPGGRRPALGRRGDDRGARRRWCACRRRRRCCGSRRWRRIWGSSLDSPRHRVSHRAGDPPGRLPQAARGAGGDCRAGARPGPLFGRGGGFPLQAFGQDQVAVAGRDGPGGGPQAARAGAVCVAFGARRGDPPVARAVRGVVRGSGLAPGVEPAHPQTGQGGLTRV